MLMNTHTAPSDHSRMRILISRETRYRQTGGFSSLEELIIRNHGGGRTHDGRNLRVGSGLNHLHSGRDMSNRSTTRDQTEVRSGRKSERHFAKRYAEGLKMDYMNCSFVGPGKG